MSILPSFRYHPDPLSTGSVKPSSQSCDCCGQARGHVYRGPFYSAKEVEAICPWCVADGSAASKFSGSFVDDQTFAETSIPEPVVEEVCQRTPSYSGWQQEQWLCHCADACEFHGELPAAELRAADEATRDRWGSRIGLPRGHWEELLTRYPNADEVLFKFRCRHCGLISLALDLS